MKEELIWCTFEMIMARETEVLGQESFPLTLYSP